MGRVKVAGFSVSVDGYGAGPEQSLHNPLGKRGTELHQWLFDTRFFHEMTGREGGGADSVDQAYAQRAMAGFGAYILGRNMYGPIRGAWDGTDWTGWWGDNPPYDAPTFILTHHAHPPIEMAGGTTFIVSVSSSIVDAGRPRQSVQRGVERPRFRDRLWLERKHR